MQSSSSSSLRNSRRCGVASGLHGHHRTRAPLHLNLQEGSTRRRRPAANREFCARAGADAARMESATSTMGPGAIPLAACAQLRRALKFRRPCAAEGRGRVARFPSRYTLKSSMRDLSSAPRAMQELSASRQSIWSCVSNKKLYVSLF